MTSSAVSIASNIAERDELNTQKQSINHFHIARGSCAELMTQLIIAKEIGVIDWIQADALINKCDLLSLMRHKLIQVRKKTVNLKYKS